MKIYKLTTKCNLKSSWVSILVSCVCGHKIKFYSSQIFYCLDL